MIDVGGRARHYLLARLMERAREQGVGVPAMVSTDYINTIPPEQEPWFPGDELLERRIRAYIRWSAMAMVDRSNHSSTPSADTSRPRRPRRSTVGFNHFFQGKRDGGFGDQIYFQGPPLPACTPGRSSRDASRRSSSTASGEVDGGGLSSYPHRGACRSSGSSRPCRWASGRSSAVYQARFNRYLLHRELVDTSAARVWSFVGDGEMDEPESMAALSIAAREQLDNLIFVVNCNLQRLDGPVRGNGKIIQELEAIFAAGWNVIKVIWGHPAGTRSCCWRRRRRTRQQDEQHGRRRVRNARSRAAATSASTSSGPTRGCGGWWSTSPTTTCACCRAAGDYRKLYAAYKMAVEHEGSPTVILAKTIKGWTLGSTIESRNATHQIKKLTARGSRCSRPTAAPHPRL